MVAEALLRAAIYPEALPLPVIVNLHRPALPVVALDAEMVVALGSQVRKAVARLQESLGKGYACRDAAAVHFAYGNRCILGNVPRLGGIVGCGRYKAQGNDGNGRKQ